MRKKILLMVCLLVFSQAKVVYGQPVADNEEVTPPNETPLSDRPLVNNNDCCYCISDSVEDEKKNLRVGKPCGEKDSFQKLNLTSICAKKRTFRCFRDRNINGDDPKIMPTIKCYDGGRGVYVTLSPLSNIVHNVKPPCETTHSFLFLDDPLKTINCNQTILRLTEGDHCSQFLTGCPFKDDKGNDISTNRGYVCDLLKSYLNRRISKPIKFVIPERPLGFDLPDNLCLNPADLSLLGNLARIKIEITPSNPLPNAIEIQRCEGNACGVPFKNIEKFCASNVAPEKPKAPAPPERAQPPANKKNTVTLLVYTDPLKCPPCQQLEDFFKTALGMTLPKKIRKPENWDIKPPKIPAVYFDTNGVVDNTPTLGFNPQEILRRYNEKMNAK
jgi:hypothetical protein